MSREQHQIRCHPCVSGRVGGRSMISVQLMFPRLKVYQHHVLITLQMPNLAAPQTRIGVERVPVLWAIYRGGGGLKPAMWFNAQCHFVVMMHEYNPGQCCINTS